MKNVSRKAAWGLAGLLTLTALVVLATNVFLRTRLLRDILNATPDRLAVDYRGPACWFPGRVSFDSVTLRSRDRNIEFEASLEGVNLRVSLADLLRRRFHPTRVRAESLRFRLRERLTRAEATAARLARYPPIDGFPGPPLLGVPADPEPSRNPWRIVIDDLAVATVKEIWIDAWRWTGAARVTGGFDLLPGRLARVGPARLEVASGVLRHGRSTVADRTSGAVWCELPRYEPKKWPGDEVWKILSGGSELRGDLSDLAFLSSDAGGPRVSGGRGPVLARVGLRNGAGRVRLSVVADDLTVRLGKRVFRGSAHVEAPELQVDFRKGEALLGGTKVVLSDLSVEGASPGPWAATFSTPAARLFLADGSLDANLVGTLPDARPVVGFLPSGLAKGIASLLRLKNLDVSGRLQTGPSRLALTRIRLLAGDFSLVGDYRSAQGRRHGEFRATKGRLSIRFTVPGKG